MKVGRLESSKTGNGKYFECKLTSEVWQKRQWQCGIK